MDKVNILAGQIMSVSGPNYGNKSKYAGKVYVRRLNCAQRVRYANRDVNVAFLYGWGLTQEATIGLFLE